MLELERQQKIAEIKIRRRIERLQLQKLNNQKQYFEIVKERFQRTKDNSTLTDIEVEIEKNDEMIKEEIKKKIDMEEQDIKFFQRVRMVMSNFKNREKN